MAERLSTKDRSPNRRFKVNADLDIQIGGDGGAFAHLGDDSGGLVLDVDDPAAFRQALSGLSLTVPAPLLEGLSADVPLRVRSAGRDLAHVRLDRRGALRVKPTAAGLLAAAEIAIPRWRQLLLVGAVAATAALIIGRYLGSRPGGT